MSGLGSAGNRHEAHAVESGGGALPHLGAIQRAFGRHDARGISALVGGRAREVTGALHAEAYAAGETVGFRTPPTLHTAAHEAAHVVQQRAGVSSQGGVGTRGDPYEQHADRVADAVVAGRSVEALLDRSPSGGGRAGPAIQKKEGEASNAAAYDAGADPDVQPAEGDTEGDELRKAVLAAARRRLAEKTEIVSQEAIEDKRKGNVTFKLLAGITLKLPLGTPMKNFTTCIEFAGQTFRDGANATGDDAKGRLALSRGLPVFMLLFNKEVELHLMLKGFQKTIEQWQDADDARPADRKKMKPLDRLNYELDQHTAKRDQLESTLPSAEEAKGLDARGKAELDATRKRIKAELAAIKKVDAALQSIQQKIDELKAKIEKATTDSSTVTALNEPYMRAEQLGAGKRPRPGEYVLTGAAGSQPYFAGGKQENTVTLQEGMFKHIAVFNGMDDTKDLPDDGAWEAWKTIDGGGIEPVGKTVYVQVEPPYAVRHLAPNPNAPWETSKTKLLGWVDADKLAELARNDEAATAAGIRKKK